MTYPPAIVNTIDNTLNLLQLSDLHLPLNKTNEINGCNCYQSFQDCLTQALNENIRCDLILVTGDLVDEVKPEIYDRIFSVLSATGVPFVCIPGNHDVTDEWDSHLPFAQRKFIAHQPDARLLAQYCLKANNWKILLLNSAIPGKVGGKIKPQDLTWLENQLNSFDSNVPTIIAMHHHTMPMQANWINEHITKNSKQFWELIKKFPNVKAVVNGHVHQQNMCVCDHIANYSTPSTCYQFDPNEDSFCLDQVALPGYRWLRLHQDGTIDSWINRLPLRSTDDNCF